MDGNESLAISLTGEHRIFGCYLLRDPSRVVTIRPSAPSRNMLTYEFAHAVPIRAYQDTHGIEAQHVMVYMDSFFYLGGKGEETFLDQIDSKNEKFRHYFTEHIHQLGYHVYCARYATLSTIQLSQNTTGEIRATGLAGVIAVYPAIADYKLREQHLVLGLHFQYYWDYYERTGNSTTLDRKHYEESKGFRSFYRGQAKVAPSSGKGLKYFAFEAKPLTVGKVWDLTEKHLQEINTKSALGDIRDTKGDKEKYVKRVAVYVCAGARLLLVDENHQLHFKEEHNRSIIDPGGLVVVDGTEFNIGLPQVDKFGVPISMGWKAFIRKWVTDPAKLEAFGLDQINNPVIFLGAVESQFNSIVYEMSVERNFNAPGSLSEEFSHKGSKYLRVRRTTHLLPPEGSAILAVEDWDTTGLQEIMARHRYEQLHRGVTFLRDRNNRSYQEEGNRHFIAPEGQMLANIAEPFTRTTRVEFDFTEEFRQRDPGFSREPPRVEFNFITTTLNDEGRKHMTAEDNRHLPSAPAYPPVLIDKKLYYLPQTLFSGSEMYDIFHMFKVYKGLDLEAMDRTEEFVMKLQIKEKKRFDEYYWEKDPTHPVKEPNVWRYLASDFRTRLGVDGHWYEKTNQKIGTVCTRYYEIISLSADSKIPAVPEDSSTPKRPVDKSTKDKESTKKRKSTLPPSHKIFARSSSESSSGSPEKSKAENLPKSGSSQQSGPSVVTPPKRPSSGKEGESKRSQTDDPGVSVQSTKKKKSTIPPEYRKFFKRSSSSSSGSPEKSKAENLPESGSSKQSGPSVVTPPVVDIPTSSASAVPPESRQPSVRDDERRRPTTDQPMHRSGDRHTGPSGAGPSGQQRRPRTDPPRSEGGHTSSSGAGYGAGPSGQQSRSSDVRPRSDSKDKRRERSPKPRREHSGSGSGRRGDSGSGSGRRGDSGSGSRHRSSRSGNTRSGRTHRESHSRSPHSRDREGRTRRKSRSPRPQSKRSRK